MSGRAATETIIPGQYALSVGNAGMPAPAGWRWVALGDVARLESGHTPSREHPEYWNGGIPWIGIRDARENHGGTIRETQQTVTQAGLDNSAARLLPTGTVCLSRTASVGYVVVMGKEMATSQDFVNWICKPDLDPQFLKYLLIAEKQSLFRFGKGSTHTTIYYPEVKAFHICLPPITEQRRIVVRLDALLSRIRSAGDTLDLVPALIEKLRKAASGDAESGFGSNELTLDTVCHFVSDGTHQSPKISDKGIPFIRITELDYDTIHWDRVCKWVSPEIHQSLTIRRKPTIGDILYSVVGTFGIAAEIKEQRDFIFQRHIAHLSPKRQLVIPRYLMHILNSPHVYEQARAVARGAAQPTVTLGDLRKFSIPVPPLSEQEEIVRRIDSLFSRADALSAEVKAARERLDVLEQAVLAKAFRGELVPQDPNDEPASVLLERIRAQRAEGESEGSSKRGRGRPRKAADVRG